MPSKQGNKGKCRQNKETKVSLQNKETKVSLQNKETKVSVVKTRKQR